MLSEHNRILIKEHLSALQNLASGFKDDPAVSLFEEFLREEEFGLALDVARDFFSLHLELTNDADKHICALTTIMGVE